MDQARLSMKAYICLMISISKCCPRWRGFFVLSAIALITLSAQGCNSKGGSTATEDSDAVSADTLPGDFSAFFDRFHEDSVYQVEHIMFPLEGLPASTGDGDTLTSLRYFWQKADWKIHRHINDPGQNFDNWFEVTDARVIEHWIQMKGTNLYMRRRFAKLDDGWYLIYYQGLRPVNRE